MTHHTRTGKDDMAAFADQDFASFCHFVPATSLSPVQLKAELPCVALVIESKNTRPEQTFQPRGVLLHTTQNPEMFDLIHSITRPNGNSVHFSISKALGGGRYPAKIVQHASMRTRALHAGDSSWGPIAENINRPSIYPTINHQFLGVELVSGLGETIQPQQYQALIQLLQQIMRHNPNIRPDLILGHNEVCLPRGRKTDPETLDWNILAAAGVAVPRPLQEPDLLALAAE